MSVDLSKVYPIPVKGPCGEVQLFPSFMDEEGERTLESLVAETEELERGDLTTFKPLKLQALIEPLTRIINLAGREDVKTSNLEGCFLDLRTIKNGLWK